MLPKLRFVSRFLAISLCLGIVLTVGAAEKDKKKKGSGKPTVPNGAGTEVYMAQLRTVFGQWDRNRDGSVDKSELAIVFRGLNAKPFDYVPEGKTAPTNPDYSKFADYNVLEQLDLDDDDKISRDEFDVWAKGYAAQLKEQADLVRRIQQAQAQLLRPNAGRGKGKGKNGNRQATQNRLKRDQQRLRQLQAKNKALQRQLQKQKQNRNQQKNKNKNRNKQKKRGRR